MTTAPTGRRTQVRRTLDGAAEAQRRRSTRVGAAIVGCALLTACACGGAIGAIVEHLRIG